VRIFYGAKEMALHPRVEPGLEKRISLPDRPERQRTKRREQSLREEQELRAAGAELGELVAKLRAEHGGRAVRPIRQLHRLYLDYPTEALRETIRSALSYGLTDLVRLERMLLRRIAGEYFRLLPPTRKDGDDDEEI
jgi:hypothetical protein